jgi:hypothetical protein
MSSTEPVEATATEGAPEPPYASAFTSTITTFHSWTALPATCLAKGSSTVNSHSDVPGPQIGLQ